MTRQQKSILQIAQKSINTLMISYTPLSTDKNMSNTHISKWITPNTIITFWYIFPFSLGFTYGWKSSIPIIRHIFTFEL